MFWNKILFPLSRIEINKPDKNPEGFDILNKKWFKPSFTLYTSMGNITTQEVLDTDKLFKLYQLILASHKNMIKRGK